MLKTGMQIILSKNQDFDLVCEICGNNIQFSLQWKEEVLPSVQMFADNLHQARTAEEQKWQLNELHKPQSRSTQPSSPAAEYRSSASCPGHSSNSGQSPHCRECGSTCPASSQLQL